MIGDDQPRPRLPTFQVSGPGNNVAFHSYFDCTNLHDKDTGHRLLPEPDGSFTTYFPKSAAKFKELFGAPAQGEHRAP